MKYRFAVNYGTLSNKTHFSILEELTVMLAWNEQEAGKILGKMLHYKQGQIAQRSAVIDRRDTDVTRRQIHTDAFKYIIMQKQN